MAIGSGGPFALAAARALVRYSDLTATEIARESIKITSEICIYTNNRITLEELDLETEPEKTAKPEKSDGPEKAERKDKEKS
jgi:ATP-dependent HslUV protease subunit HslV